MGLRVVLSGGGTGGHIYPALAVAEQLRGDPEVEAILYIGALGFLEERLAREKGLQFRGLKVSGLPRKFSSRLVTWPIEFASAVVSARALLAEFQPAVLIGTGGYASAPPLAAAWLSKIPYAIHEPDAHPGLVNRAFAVSASLISLGMEGAAPSFKACRGAVRFNGNPVSKSFVEPLSRDAACAVLGLDPQKRTVVITGGSQGAQAVNEAVLEALPLLLEIQPEVQVVHQCGEKNFHLMRERLSPAIAQNRRYLLRAYFEDVALAYSVADLAVCRSGAMTIAELGVMGIPALFVPYPFAAADHQTHNARFVAQRGGAVVILQKDLSARSLMDGIAGLLMDPLKLGRMKEAMRSLGKPHAAADLTGQLKEIALKL